MPTAPTTRNHLFVLASIVAASLIAALRPEWFLSLHLRCGMQLLFGLKCPFCGMTRDFVSIWHHQKPGNNPGSWVAFVFIYCIYPLLLVWSRIARRPPILLHPGVRAVIFSAIAVLWVANNLHS